MERHPDLLALLDRCTPACEPDHVQWKQPLEVTAYVSPRALPDELVTSVRVIVLVEDSVVVCTNRDGSHVWPGGHREPGETLVETACREVHEETGWLLEPASVEPIGFIVLTNLGEPNPPYPYPDAIHAVVAGRANDRAAEEWTDVEGWETSSALRPLRDLGVEVQRLCRPFLELLRARA